MEADFSTDQGLEHKTAPVESGGAGHALAECTRRKLAAGHLSRSEIAELNRLKGEASRASSTNSDEAHPAAAPGVGAEHGYRSGVEQPVAGEHAIAQSAKIHTAPQAAAQMECSQRIRSFGTTNQVERQAAHWVGFRPPLRLS